MYVDNIRLCRYRERLTGYNFDLSWHEGKTNQIADALSRAPVFPATETDSDNLVDVCHAISTLQKDPESILAPMMKAAKDDIDYQTIIQALGKIKNPKSLPLNHSG